MLETAMLTSFLVASAGQNRSALIAVASALTAIIFTKAVDWIFQKGRRSYEQKRSRRQSWQSLKRLFKLCACGNTKIFLTRILSNGW